MVDDSSFYLEFDCVLCGHSLFSIPLKLRDLQKTVITNICMKQEGKLRHVCIQPWEYSFSFHEAFKPGV